MELASWLKSGKDENFPILGLESFETFLKVCSQFAEWALDDIGLANRNNAYKVWICWVKPEDLSKVKKALERYSSMKLLLHYYDMNIVERNKIGLYVKLDWKEEKWVLSYGITNNKQMFKVGEFDYTFTTKLPEHQILKYVTDELTDFNPRQHLLLFKIKQDAATFNPGYCQITDPQIIDKEITISTFGLGQWTTDGMVNGEAEKYVQVFKDWVKTQKWWALVHLIIRPRKISKCCDFIIQLK
jgi:hypothetical protein